MIRVRLGFVAALARLAVACGAAYKDVRKAKNGFIALNWHGEGIYLVDPLTSARHVIPRTESAVEIAWSPDGRAIAFELPGEVLGIDVYRSGPTAAVCGPC